MRSQKAYLFQYKKNGLEETEIDQYFDQFQFIIDSYENINSSNS